MHRNGNNFKERNLIRVRNLW